jgi:hypothetical protein
VKVRAESSDESDEDKIVKKLKKNFSAYNESDESESEAARSRTKKKSISKKFKKSGLLGDDDFCADSDEDKSESKKEPVKIYTGKPGRPKVKNSGEKKRSMDKSEEKAKKNDSDSAKSSKLDANGKKVTKRIEKSNEPMKKKPKISTTTIKTEPVVNENEKKRRASSEIESEFDFLICWEIGIKIF